jgi:DNA sulfur modification protein DndD
MMTLLGSFETLASILSGRSDVDVRIRGWKCQHLRGGLRNLSIDLGSDPARWTLVQMPNGTGKTTTMQLFTAVLTNRDWTIDDVQALRPSSDINVGSFELQLLIGNDPFSLAVEFDFDAGTASYSTARVKSEGGGKEPGILLPDPLRIMLTPDFARLVVFDGELAKQIRDLKRSEATLAIRRLYRLELLDALADVARRQAEAVKKKVVASQAETQKGLRRRQTMFDDVEFALGALLLRQQDLQSERDKLIAERAQTEGLINTRVSTRTDRARLLEERRAIEQSATEDIRAESQRLLEMLRTPAAIHERVLDRLRALGGKLDRLKLPQTMSQEFFFELAEQSSCVCGRAIGPIEHDAILERAPQYLAENQIAIINAMKSAVRMATAEPEEINRLADAINAADRRRRQASVAVQALVDAVEAEGDVAIAKAKNDLIRIAHSIDKISAELDTLEGPHPVGAEPWKKNIRAAKEELAARKRALEDATETRKLARQTEWFTDALSRTRRQAELRLTEEIRVRTNEKLKRLVPSEALDVSRIDGALVLAAEDGRARGGVSEGQSLAVAYAFLTSLFEAASYRLPFVVDSPAISLDVRVRREVAALVPDLFHQMIMFVISSEREGFADGFYARKDTRFITVWRDSSGEVQQSTDLATFKTFHKDVELDTDLQGASP